MAINFDSTMTETDFKQPLLDTAEERLAREALGEADLRVDGLASSLLGNFLLLITGRSR